MTLTRLGATNITNSTIANVTDLPFGLTNAGKVLQVQATQLQAQFATTSGSFVDVTDMSLTITPSSTSSKILLLCNTNTYNNTSSAYFNMRWERAISGGATTTFGDSTYD